MFRLEPLQKRRQRQRVEQGMEEAHVYDGVGIQSVHYYFQFQRSQQLSLSLIRSWGRNVLEAIPISSGIREPQFTTFHTVCSSSSQKARMIRRTARVKSGNRRM
jgi:hypothetical protein